MTSQIPIWTLVICVRARTLESVQRYLCAKMVSYIIWTRRACFSSLQHGYMASYDHKRSRVTVGQIAQQTCGKGDPLIQISTGCLVSSLTESALQSYHEIMEKLFHVNKLPLESYGAGPDSSHNREVTSRIPRRWGYANCCVHKKLKRRWTVKCKVHVLSSREVKKRIDYKELQDFVSLRNGVRDPDYLRLHWLAKWCIGKTRS